LGVDTTFRLGDADAALNICRTMRLDAGDPLHEITASLAGSLGIRSKILPATNHPLRTEIGTGPDLWMPFQEYFVMRGHRDEVLEVRYTGAAEATAAPGVVEAIRTADVVVIAPSNPPLSIWPILAIRDVATALKGAPRVMAVSPLFGGRALKGPADRVMASLGLPPGNAGVLAAYEGLLDDLFIDSGDRDDRDGLAASGVSVHVESTLVGDPERATAFAARIMELL
jgi:LPPG:FO 2-phospho-L-lactate transferase